MIALIICIASVVAAGSSLSSPLPSSSWSVPLPTTILHRGSHSSAARRVKNKLNMWTSERAAVTSSSSIRTFSPSDFGGDPTGVNDSTTAVIAAMEALLLSSKSEGVHDANGILDCGGATLDLQGGEYILSSPLRIPAYYGNLRVTGGSLRANPSSFSPPTGFLIEVGTDGGNDGNNIDISFAYLFLDASQVAAGAINATGLFGGVIGPQMYIFNFTTVGIEIQSGHEVTIMQTWVGEYWWSDKRKENATASTAVGIRLDGNDHVVDDIVVFSSHIGIEVNGGADLITNVHCWNLADGNNGTGILVNAEQTRLEGCYLDWTDIVITSPSRVSFTNGFFLCGAKIQLVAKNGIADGVYIANNQYIGEYCHKTGYNAVEAIGEFTSVSDVTVVGILADADVGITSTIRTVTVISTTPITRFEANFTGFLLFDTATVPIQTVSYSVMFDKGLFAQHTARPIEVGSSIVIIETDVAVSGRVIVTVDQSKRR